MSTVIPMPRQGLFAFAYAVFDKLPWKYSELSQVQKDVSDQQLADLFASDTTVDDAVPLIRANIKTLENV